MAIIANAHGFLPKDRDRQIKKTFFQPKFRKCVFKGVPGVPGVPTAQTFG
jgi:hypothetical protein